MKTLLLPSYVHLARALSRQPQSNSECDVHRACLSGNVFPNNANTIIKQLPSLTRLIKSFQGEARNFGVWAFEACGGKVLAIAHITTCLSSRRNIFLTFFWQRKFLLSREMPFRMFWAESITRVWINFRDSFWGQKQDLLDRKTSSRNGLGRECLQILYLVVRGGAL